MAASRLLKDDAPAPDRDILRRYELLADHTRDIVLFMRREDGQILEANRAATLAYGYSREELLGLRVHALRAPEVRQGLESDMAAADAQGILFETIHRRKDGTTFPVEVSSRGATIGNRRTLVSVIRDITRRTEAESELRRLNETLEQRVVERTALAEQRAAQLRLMVSELSQSEQRERRRLAKVLHDQLQQLLVAARIKLAVVTRKLKNDPLLQALRQVEDLLGQSLEESRSLTVELSPPVLYDGGLAAGLRWLARQVHEKHHLPVCVELLTDVEPADEDTRVFLFQAVRELLFNAVKHAGAESAAIELSCPDADHLRLTVSDTGVGCDPAVLDYRSGSSGFGLFSLRQRLELMQGTLAVESTPDVGTRMIIEVPCQRALPAPPHRAGKNRADLPDQAPRPARGGRRTAGKVRVLLADDHALLRQGLAGLLREHPQIEVVGEAADGQEALDLALQTLPDTILMDITMPVMNGVEATRRICQRLPQTQVIGLSMHEEADLAAAMLKAGAVAYLPKGISSDALVTAILSRSELHQAAER